MRTGLPRLEEFGRVMASENLKRNRLRRLPALSAGVSVEGGHILLSLKSTGLSTSEMSDILGAYHKKKKYFRLKSGEFVSLEDGGEPIRFAEGAGIRVNAVTFAYDAHSRHVLEHVNYDFPPGSSTAILGETGAGKTTLIRLILALLKPVEGQVMMYSPCEGAAEHAVPVSARTRCNLVYVPQGNSLFSGTLRWNLLLGNPDATEAQMREVLQLACADFVLSLPDGLDTLVGEGGAGLSEGQAQRIAVARALLRKGSILLLDEATSALDQQTEKQLLGNLITYNEQQSMKATLIFITHRPAVVEHCSQVITINKCSHS